MADESASVGKVQLDIEISQSSLNREMNKLGSVFNSSLKNMFSQTTNFVKNSLDRMTNSFKTFSQVGAGSTDKVSRNISKLNSDLEKTQSKIDETNNKLAELYAEQDNIIESYRNFPTFSGMSNEESLEQMLNADSRYSNLTSEIEGLENRLQQLRTASDTTRNSIRNLQENLSNTNNTTERTNDTTRRATNNTRRFGREINRTGQSAKKSTGKVAGFAKLIDSSFRRILKRIFIYNLIYKGIRGIINHTGAALKTNQQFVHSLNVIKTNLMVTFQPIYDFILPALNALMRGIATVTTYIASAISSLFGKTYQQSFGADKSLDDAKKAMDGYGKSAKKAQAQLAGFDEINQLDLSKDDEQGGAGSFEMTMPDTSTIDLTGFEKFKEMLQPTIDSLKNLGLALEPLKAFAVQGLKDFYNDFLLPVGQWTLGEGLPRLIDGLTKIVSGVDWSYLNVGFSNLWKSLAPFATNIGEGLLGFYEQVLVPIGTWVLGEGLPRFIDAIANGLSQINWEPIRAGLNNLWSVLTPFAINVGEGLLWFWENVLVPLGTWTINEIVPRFLNILAEAIRVLNSVIEVLKPLGLWLWDNFLLPLAKWAGGAIVDILDGIAYAFSKIADYIDGIQDIIASSDSFLDALVDVGIYLVEGLFKGILHALTGIGTWLRDNLVSPIITWVKKLFGIASPSKVFAEIGVWLVEGLFQGISNTWISIVNFFGVSLEELKKNFANTWEDIKIKAEEVWTAIKEFFVRTWEGIKTTAISVWDSIKTYTVTKWNEIKDFLSKLWDGVKDSFKRVWESMRELLPSLLDGILNVMKNSFDTFKDIGYNLFNMVWEGMKDIWNSINDWVSDKVDWLKDKLAFWKKGTDEMSGSGGGGGSRGTGGVALLPDDHPDKPGSEEYKKNNPNMPAWLGGGGIPMLARDGIVDQPTLAMVGERGKEAVVPLENTAFVDTLASALGNAVMAAMQVSSSGGSGIESSGEMILQIDGTTLGRILGPILDKEKQRIGNNVIIQPI